MKPLRLIFLFLTFAIVFSCKEKKSSPAENTKNIKDTIKRAVQNNNTKDKKIKIGEDTFPKFGKQTSDFVIEKFELISESKGDLNKDGLQDAALVLQSKKDSLADKPLLILLQQKDKSYLLYKISYTVVPQQYTEDGYKIYESQDVEISKGVLSIANIGTGGPSGNIMSNFKYFDNDFLLTYIETYDVGAGAWQSLYYNILEGKLTEEITNTMEEEMPSEKKTVQVKKQKITFEKASPKEIISAVYQQEEKQFQGL